MALGSDKTEKVDTRIIAATNKSLIELCRNGYFRWDLYYRLAVVELRLPNIRERNISEIHELFTFFLEKYKKTFFRRKALVVEHKARLAIEAYQWPGNIREMINVVEQLYVFCDKKVQLEDLPKRIQNLSENLSENWKDLEKNHLNKLMRKYEGKLSRVLDAVGYGSINTLKKKLKEYEIGS